MLRKVIAASLVLALSAGVVFAEEFQALITKVEGNKVTFYKMEGKGKDAKKTGDEMTLPVAKSVKVLRMKKKGEDPEVLDEGLKHEMLTKLPENGRRAQIVTDDDNKKITEIRIRGFGKKKQ
jgi:hypothetical protein